MIPNNKNGIPEEFLYVTFNQDQGYKKKIKL